MFVERNHKPYSFQTSFVQTDHNHICYTLVPRLCMTREVMKVAPFKKKDFVLHTNHILTDSAGTIDHRKRERKITYQFFNHIFNQIVNYLTESNFKKFTGYYFPKKSGSNELIEKSHHIFYINRAIDNLRDARNLISIIYLEKNIFALSFIFQKTDTCKNYNRWTLYLEEYNKAVIDEGIMDYHTACKRSYSFLLDMRIKPQDEKYKGYEFHFECKPNSTSITLFVLTRTYYGKVVSEYNLDLHQFVYKVPEIQRYHFCDIKLLLK